MRDVPGYEGLYTVDEEGNVYSPKGQRKVQVAKNGYLVIDLYKHNQRKTCYIHDLVLAAFVGPKPEGQEVRHKDGDRTNGCLSNLEYGTRSENALDQVAMGRHNNARKTHCPQGHEYSGVNYRGQRICSTCTSEQQRARRRKHG